MAIIIITVITICYFELTCFIFTDINCPSLPAPADGSVRFTEAENVNSKATFSCNAGFTLVQGDRWRVCRINKDEDSGVWDRQSPKCIGKQL